MNVDFVLITTIVWFSANMVRLITVIRIIIIIIITIDMIVLHLVFEP